MTLAVVGPLRAKTEAALRQHAEQLRYDDRMRLAQRSLEAGNYEQVAEVLADYVPHIPSERDLRGFEWRYLFSESQRFSSPPILDHWVRYDAIAMTADGQHLAAGAWDGVIQVFDIQQNRMKWKSSADERKHGWIVSSLCYSPDANVLASVGYDRKLVIWDVTTGKSLVDVEFSQTPRSVTFSPDGKLLAVGGGVRADDTMAIRRAIFVYSTLRKRRCIVSLPATRQACKAWPYHSMGIVWSPLAWTVESACGIQLRGSSSESFADIMVTFQALLSRGTVKSSVHE